MNKNRELKLIAHGGYPAKYPENTLQSFVEAARFQPFAIEMDVVIHPDTGRLICFHPSGLSSVMGTYDANTLRKQISTGEDFPELSVVINQIKSGLFLIDFKQPNEASFKALLEDKSIDLERIIIGIRNLNDYFLVRQINSNVQVLALFSEPDNFADFANAGGHYFRLWEKDVTAARVRAIQAVGLEVWVTPGYKATATQPRTAGEVNEAKLALLLDLMIDAVLVNDIGWVMDYLDR